jgi:hypothetical protein
MWRRCPCRAPDQPVNVEPEFATAVRITDVPLGKLPLHVAPQLIPPELLVMVPVPVPLSSTVTVTLRVNVAVTLAALLKVTVQVAVLPVQAPVQPAKVEPALGAAVKVTCDPAL